MAFRSSEWRGGVRIASALCLAGIVGGCSVYDPALLQSGGPLGAGDLPVRPDSSTSSSADSQTLVFALRDITLNQSPDLWRTIGLDLDRLTTTADNGLRECKPTSGSVPADGEDGVDNVLGQSLWEIVNITLPTLSCEIEVSHEAGRGTLLLRIENWNGQSDDSQVYAMLAPSVDGTSVDDPTAVMWNGSRLVNEIGGADANPPAWDGGDLFYPNPRFFWEGTGEPLIDTDLAYVSNNKLVVSLATGTEFELLTDIRSVPIVLNEGYLVGEMDENRQNITRGFLAGRFPIDALQNIGAPIGICEGEFSQVYASLADLLEIPRPAGVTPNPEDPCGAMSMGVGFQGTAAVWQEVAPVAVPAANWCATMPAPLEGCP